MEFFPGDYQISILDIGAALNERPPYQGLIDAGKARLLGFEPTPAECEKLNRTYGPPLRFFPCFAGDGKAATFHETNWSLTGSLFPPNTALLEKFQNLAELTTPVAQHPIETFRIDDIADISDVDFIKIDVQGSELSVLGNALRALSQTVLVQVEVEFVELYQGQPLFADVDRFMRSQGFQFHTFPGFGTRAFKPLVVNNDVNTGIRQLLWSDAIYVRDWMKLESVPTGKLRNYAILAHDILNSFDLAHLVLSALDQRQGSQIADAYLKRLLAQ
jgi:FkbM family methyltransferase